MTRRIYRVCYKTADLRTVGEAWTMAGSMDRAINLNLGTARRQNEGIAEPKDKIIFLECETKRKNL